jgi:antitoxin ParD1/3/4
MITMQITLPARLKQFIDGLVAEGTFKDPSEYLQTLVERDQHTREKARIEALLIAGFDSGPSTPMTPEDWDDIEREGQRLIAARKARKPR